MKIKLWQRYLILEFLKGFFFFLGALYLLFVIIDYSLHMQDFLTGKNISPFQVVLYYCFQFIKRAEVLLPLSILIASIRVLLSLNTCKELLAFQSGGIGRNRLLAPLFLIASLATVFNYSTMEWFAPKSLNFIDRFYDSHLSHSYRKKAEPLHVIHLDDHSKMIYQYFDPSKDAFFDVIWIRNADDLWRMKYLSADPDSASGELVDHLVRGEDGGLEKKESFHHYTFRNLNWKSDLPRKGYIPFENRSISELYSMKKNDPLLSNLEEKAIQTQLLYKIAIPLLPLLVLLAIAPFCTKSSRMIPQFFIYACALFGFISFSALMDALVILGESASLPPFAAIVVPFTALFAFFGWRFVKA